MVKYPLWFLFIFLGFISCHERPTFPDTPSISFNDYYFKEIADFSLDSLVIKIEFEDGNGDLGLESTDTNPPYHLLDVVLNAEGDSVKYGDTNTPTPYNCVDYDIIRKETSVNGSLVVTADTIYVIRNPNYYNIYLTFLVKQLSIIRPKKR